MKVFQYVIFFNPPEKWEPPTIMVQSDCEPHIVDQGFVVAASEDKARNQIARKIPDHFQHRLVEKYVETICRPF